MPCRVARHCGATRAVERGSDNSDTCPVPRADRLQERGYLVDVLFDDDEVEALGNAYSECLHNMASQGGLKSIRDGKLADGTRTQVYQIRAAHLQHRLFADLIHNFSTSSNA